MPELFDVLTYDYEKYSQVLNVPETYFQIGTLTTPSDREAGVYEVGFSLTARFTAQNKSIFLRFRVNGGDWTEWQNEPKDVTDVNPAYYAFPLLLGSGAKTLELEAKKEDAQSPQLDFDFVDLFIQRKN